MPANAHLASKQEEELKPGTLGLSVRADGRYWPGTEPMSDEALAARTGSELES